METLHKYIEHTKLNPDLIDTDIDQVVREAIEHDFLGVCIPPFWVKRAARDLKNKDTKLVTVIGFPFGYQMTEVKLEEMKLAIRDGADELDWVWNISSFKTGMPWTKIELAKAAEMAHHGEKILKVIIETAYLSEEEIIEACKVCSDAGVDIVKTSTGYAGKGATTEHIALMRKHLPEHVGIKASGGIKTSDFAWELIKSGADRLGTSAGIALVSGKTSTSGY
jgi:deoxyribose-phosphate aldolase